MTIKPYSLKNKNRRMYSILCLLMLFSICTYAQEARTVSKKPVQVLAKTNASKVNLNTVKVEKKDDPIMKEVVSAFNQNNEQFLNELKIQDVAKYTTLMNSIQEIYELEKNILILTKTPALTVDEEDNQVKEINVLKTKLAEIKSQYSLE